MEARKFADVFIKKEANEIVKGYKKFREEAIENPEKFNILWNSLKSRKKEIREWKLDVFNSFNSLIGICSGEGTNNEKEKRQKLIGGIISILREMAEKMPRYMKEEEYGVIQYGILYLMLDVIWAFSDKKHKIQFPAMIYDIVCKMNQQEKMLEEFYGRKAEEEIIRYTLSIVTIVAEKENCTEYDWLVKALEKQDKEFAIQFGGKMQDALSKITNDAKKSEEKERSPLWLQLIVAFLVLAITFIIGKWIGRVNAEKVKSEQWKSEMESFQEKIIELENENKNLKKEKIDLEKEMMQKENADSLGEVSGNSISGVNLNSDESKYQKIRMPFERNIRSQKSLQSLVVGNVNEGEEVLILVEDAGEGWVVIQYESKEGDIVGYVLMEDVR